MHKWISEGDLIWTRDLLGQYYLARVISRWEYWMSEEAVNLDIDIGNIVRCAFLEVELDKVPGKVKACFRPARTIQKIADATVLEYSKLLWNQFQDIYIIEKGNYPDIFKMLDADETEDLIFLYLQSKGWFVVPNSRKADTMAFEYLVINPKTGERAQTQVKTGDTPLDQDEYSDSRDKVFLFQANERYRGSKRDNVVCIKRIEIEEFLTSEISWLPKIYLEKTRLMAM
jgi:hypothetical protein